MYGSRFRMYGSGFMVQDLVQARTGLRVQGSWLKMYSVGFRLEDVLFMVYGSGSRAGAGFRV